MSALVKKCIQKCKISGGNASKMDTSEYMHAIVYEFSCANAETGWTELKNGK